MNRQRCCPFYFLFAFTFLTTHTLKWAIFSGKPGLIFHRCQPLPMISRSECSFLCLNEKACFAFNFMQNQDATRTVCMTCLRDEVFMWSSISSPGQESIAFVKTNRNLDNQENRGYRFIHFPSGLKERDIITLVGLPDGQDFYWIFANSDWSLADPDGYRKADCDLVCNLYFENGEPTNMTFRTYDQLSNALSDAFVVHYDLVHSSYLVVGQVLTITVFVKNSDNYAILHQDQNIISSRPLAKRVSLSDVKYLLIPPVIKKVMWYDSTEK